MDGFGSVHRVFGRVAQLVEQRSFKPQCVGSSPIPSIRYNRLALCIADERERGRQTEFDSQPVSIDHLTEDANSGGVLGGSIPPHVHSMSNQRA
jgi:hypothetical protein